LLLNKRLAAFVVVVVVVVCCIRNDTSNGFVSQEVKHDFGKNHGSAISKSANFVISGQPPRSSLFWIALAKVASYILYLRAYLPTFPTIFGVEFYEYGGKIDQR
jgi:hypothetical protein